VPRQQSSDAERVQADHYGGAREPARLLDADAEGADRAEVARIVLHIDPSGEPERVGARHNYSITAPPGYRLTYQMCRVIRRSDQPQLRKMTRPSRDQ
jgi:hypothetical protein